MIPFTHQKYTDKKIFVCKKKAIIEFSSNIWYKWLVIGMKMIKISKPKCMEIYLRSTFFIWWKIWKVIIQMSAIMRKAFTKLKISGICISPNVSIFVSCIVSAKEGRRTFLNNNSKVNTNIPLVNRPIFVFVTGPSSKFSIAIYLMDHMMCDYIVDFPLRVWYGVK